MSDVLVDEDYLWALETKEASSVTRNEYRKAREILEGSDGPYMRDE